MPERVSVDVGTVCEKYVFLLEALGYRVNQAALKAHLGGKSEEKGRSAKRPDGPNGSAGRRRIQSLYDNLGDLLAAELAADRSLFNGKALDEEEIRRVLGAAAPERRQTLARAIESGMHAPFVGPREMPIGDFHRLLKEYAQGQSIARTKLIEHLRGQFAARGIEMSFDAIEERFRSNTKVRSMPACAEEIIRALGPEFRTGLIPIEEMTGERDPQEWLDEVRAKLHMRSSAMHKAIAEATGLKYDAVHKALSGKKKAQRIQGGIKECLDRWLAAVEKGEPIDVNPEYRGCAVEDLRRLLPALAGRFRSKEAVYRQLSRMVAIKPGSIRRYFQGSGKILCVPLNLFECAQSLASGQPSIRRRSYLDNQHIRMRAYALADRANRILRAWHENDENDELEMEFRNLRLSIIVTMKEQRAAC